MKAGAMSLTAAFNSPEVDYYTIPQYQRPYTWKLDECETLWNDLNEAYNASREADQTGTGSENYFLGPIIFVQNSTKRSFDIIDGQQRITTFHILFWYLLRELKDETEKKRIQLILTFLNINSKLKVSNRDAATFLLIQTNSQEIPGNSLMASAANYFCSRVKTINDPDSFSIFLREKTQFIVIVADDYGRAWDLFIGINGKGVALNPTDLIKAFVCGNSDIGESIGDVWETQITPLRGASTQFLLFLTRFKSKEYVSEQNLFRKFSAVFPITLKSHELVKYSNIFKLFWITPIEEIELGLTTDASFTPGSKKHLKILRNLDRWDITTLVMKFADVFGLDAVFKEDFLELNASFQIRLAATGKHTRDKRILTHFKDKTFTPSDKTGALSLIYNYFKTESPDDNDFKKAVSSLSYNNSTMRTILQAHEEGIRGLRGVEYFELEHLMPRTGTEYWFVATNTKDEIQYRKIVDNIGNLFVLDRVTNNQVKNKNLPEKKEYYSREVKNWSITAVTSKKETWMPFDIDARANEIAEWTLKQWPFLPPVK